jgi:hypothetical protein
MVKRILKRGRGSQNNEAVFLAQKIKHLSRRTEYAQGGIPNPAFAPGFDAKLGNVAEASTAMEDCGEGHVYSRQNQ